MIQKLIIKWIFGAIFKAIKRKREWKKMEDYVNNPNELDVKVRRIYSRLVDLEKDSHPRADWICLECGCKAKRKETPRMKRRKRRLKKEK